ncbi:LytR C-terminal domain-containing protein [Amycolatopsis jejuensis]|uniref:LytR C-terminal domain-containing protein n=1 Tax=Amycolatopsis jejuensis TaxID=330084 RepID=UPI000B0C6CA1|nr:LytR C-terminal domain-containing protein [Amycolatopsis jejuensis]
MSFFSGLSRPLRAAGVALIGVAVVAAVIGGVTVLNTGSSSDNNAGPTSSGEPSGPGGGAPSSPAPSSAPSSAPSTAPSTTSSSAPPSSAPPSSPAGQPGQPGGQQGPDQKASNKWVTLRVYNNSLIQHLAEQAADDFRRSGWNVAEIGNYAQGVIQRTTAYFRPGTDEEAAAKQLAAEFGFQAQPRFEGIQNSSPGVIVIITKDYQAGRKGS